MKPPIALDFLAAEPRLPPAGLALLAAALTGAALLGWQHVRLQAELDTLRAGLEARQSAPRALRGAPPETAADLKRAQEVLRRLDAQWNALFSAVESALGADVALLAIQPDLAAGRVTLNGEAKSLPAALDFAARLNRGAVLSEAMLGAHEVRVNDAHRPVRFTLGARWGQR